MLADLTDGSGTVRHLSVGAGQDGHIYVVNRDAMGKFNAGSNNGYQDLSGVLGGAYGVCPRTSTVRYNYGAVETRSRHSRLPTPGSRPVRSTRPAILFAIRERLPAFRRTVPTSALCGRSKTRLRPCCMPTMPSNLHELYNSNQAGGRDQLGAGNKFITPTIVTGRVYVGTTDSVEVLGLLP